MTVKTAVSFTERHHEFAERTVRECSCASVSGLIAQGIDRLMQEESEREAVLAGKADAIRARMQAPRSEYTALDERDTEFEDVRRRLKRERCRSMEFSSTQAWRMISPTSPS